MINIQAQNVEKAKKMLWMAPDKIAQAAARAINRTATHVQAKSSQTIRKTYTINAKSAKRKMKKRRANKNHLVATIVCAGQPFLLTKFKTENNKEGPIKVKVKKKSTLKQVKGLFIGKSKKNYSGPMLRERRSSYPLRIPYGPSLPAMFGSEDVVSIVEKSAENMLNDRFNHEVVEILRKL